MSERLDAQAQEWPLRPWIMGAICAIAGLAFHLLTDHDYGEQLSATRQAAATFVAVATLSFVVTVERLRWPWAVAFAVGWGLVTAFVGWFTASYTATARSPNFPISPGCSRSCSPRPCSRRSATKARGASPIRGSTPTPGPTR